jgi:hypothetical protein
MQHRGLHVATWLLSRVVPEGERESLLGDLIEEYELRANAATSSAALKWYLRQVCASAPPLLWVRFRRASWISTLGVALLAYFAVGVVEFIINWALSISPWAGAVTYRPLGLFITSPFVVLIGYFAARIRRGAAIALGAMMLLVVTAMTLWTSESIPSWYRIAFFVVGPVAALFGSALRSLRSLK